MFDPSWISWAASTFRHDAGREGPDAPVREASRAQERGLQRVPDMALPCTAGAPGERHEPGFSQAAFRQLQLPHLARALCVSVARAWAPFEAARPRP